MTFLLWKGAQPAEPQRPGPSLLSSSVRVSGIRHIHAVWQPSQHHHRFQNCLLGRPTLGPHRTLASQPRPPPSAPASRDLAAPGSWSPTVAVPWFLASFTEPSVLQTGPLSRVPDSPKRRSSKTNRKHCVWPFLESDQTGGSAMPRAAVWLPRRRKGKSFLCLDGVSLFRVLGVTSGGVTYVEVLCWGRTPLESAALGAVVAHVASGQLRAGGPCCFTL